MEAFAGFLSHTDHEIGRLVEYLERSGEPRQHRAGGAVRQRGELRGRSRPGRSTTSGLEHGAAVGGRGPGPDRRDRRAALPQQLPVGMDRGRQHPVPPVEARGARGRGGRPDDRALAGRHRRHRAPCAASTSTPSTCCPRCSRCSGSRRPPSWAAWPQTPSTGSPSPTASPTGGPRPPPRAVLRDLRVPGPLRGRVEGRDLPPDPGHLGRLRGGPVGALPRGRRPVGVPRPGRPGARAAPGARRPVVGGGAEVRGPAARQPALLGPGLRPAGGRAAAPALRLPEGPRVVPEPVAVNVRNREHRIRATVDVPDPAPGAPRSRA